jgi:hypothetical protein
MKENLLHFIWKLKLFAVSKLVSVAGEKITVISAGNQNLNTGPDFENAKILIDDQLWYGNVEIHVKSSHWYAHNHEIDDRYNSIILHVVWEHDVPVFRNKNIEITTLELKNFISLNLLDSYANLFNKNTNWINCENQIKLTDEFVFNHWIERLYIERLEVKALAIEQILNKTENNWEATLFIMMAKSFGLKINGEAFYNFAVSVNFEIVRKVSHNLVQLEALFFGQAGLLHDTVDSSYYVKLQNEYKFLQSKYKLSPISSNQVQFFRLRPQNFPTIRLSQLAVLYHKLPNLFAQLMEFKQINQFYNLLGVSTTDFWKTHYTFNKVTVFSSKRLTKSFIDLLLINTIIPLKFVYLKFIGKQNFNTLLDVLSELKPEKNSIISNFNSIDIKSENALKTQALLQLKNEYCNKKRCLECEIGKHILTNQP